MKTVAIIGLGKFGYEIANSLSNIKEYSIIAVDSDKNKVQKISEFVENSFILDSTNAKALEEVGISNLDLVIVSIGENVEASIMTVMALKDLGNKKIVAKAITAVHGDILAKIGAFKVIYPERIAAKKLIRNIIDDITFDIIDISNHIKIMKLLATSSMIGLSVEDIEKNNTGIKLIALKHDESWHTTIEKSNIIKMGDMLAFVGDSADLDEFYKKIK